MYKCHLVSDVTLTRLLRKALERHSAPWWQIQINVCSLLQNILERYSWNKNALPEYFRWLRNQNKLHELCRLDLKYGVRTNTIHSGNFILFQNIILLEIRELEIIHDKTYL